MTPQEKAKELFDRYYNQIDKVVIERFVALQEHEDCAKACALIAVDAIEDTLQLLALTDHLPTAKMVRWERIHLKAVKAEIEKL